MRSCADEPYAFASAGPMRRAVRLAVTRGPVARLSARILPSTDRLAFAASRGRVTPSAWVTGLPVVQLRTVGARSGRPRSARVLAVPEGAGLLVVAANFGSTTHPAWAHNLRAHPRVTVLAAEAARDYDARELHGAERERGFDRALALNPGWRRFRRQAGQRAIPVFELTPSAGSNRTADRSRPPA